MCTATCSPLSCGYRATPVTWPSLLSRKKRHGALELAHAPFHLLEALHHLLELRVLLQQPVDVGDLGAAALGDPRPAAAVDDRRFDALVRCHRADDRLEAPEILLLALELLGHALGALEHRQHLHDLPERTHGAELLQLGGEVLEGEALLADLP